MDFIIRRKTLISMLFIALTMLGYISYNRLSMELYPTPEMPYMVVMINSKIEVDPEYMEKKAIIPVEGAIGQLEGVQEISSYASRKNGTIEISYSEKTDLKFAYLRLQEKINEIKTTLGDEFTLVVNKVDTRSLVNQFMNLQVLGEGGTDQLRNFADQKIAPKLENIDGIASVNTFGGRKKSVEIVMDPQVAEAYNLTSARLRKLLSSGQYSRTSVGEAYKANEKYYVNLTAEFTAISDIENVVVDNKGPVLLKDIAEISFGTQEETSYSRVNGKDAISMMLINDNSTNIIELSHRTRAVIAELNEDLKSSNIEIIVESDTAETMEDNINQIIKLALIGGLLAVLILWFFIRNIRLVAAVSLAIPISVYAAFNFFYAYNISINSLTLVGIALAIGMLIDNSVVVLENIYRLASSGMKTYQSVIQGTSEVLRSIFAATLTTICVFLPFLFSSDVVVKLMGKQIGVSIISTLAVSFFAAILFIPMVTYLIMNRKKGDQSTINFEKISIRNRFIQIYLLLLKTAMRNPAATIIIGIVLFFATLLISLTLSTNSLKEVEAKEIKVYVTMPQGATLETTNAVVADLEKDLLIVKEQEKITSKTEEGTGIITLKLKDKYEKIDDKNLSDVKGQIQKITYKYHDRAEIDFEQSASNDRFSSGGSAVKQSQRMTRMMGVGTNQERVVIKGEDFGTMKQVAEDIQYYLSDMDEITKARTNLQSDKPEVHLKFDPETMGRFNIPIANVSSELNSFKKEIESGFTFKQNNEEYSIILKLDTLAKVKPNTFSDLEKLSVNNGDSASYEMQNISRIYYSKGISRINRVNQQKEIEITYNFTNDINNTKELLDNARSAVDEMVGTLILPPGVAVEVIHSEDDYNEYYWLIGVAFLLIFMILASVFESFSTPFVLMFSIPLAGIGSLLGLIFTGNSLLNANTLTGFLILLGIVVNNGIILIDYSNILQKRGYRQSRALITAGIARLRPIMITAITTIVGMLPLALGVSDFAGTIGASFAVTVIGGLALSTVLTLVFIPTFYFGLQNTLKWFKNLPLWIKLTQYALFVVAGYFIYAKIDSFIWQMIDVIAVIICVPALTWFLLNSLRKSEEMVIGADENITIRVQNLVKVYDRDGRFMREWKGGKKLRDDMGEAKVYKSLSDLNAIAYQVPIIAFIVYLLFFHLKSPVWQFIFALILYFALLAMIEPFVKLFQFKADSGNSTVMLKIVKAKRWIIFWIYPLATIVAFYLTYKNIGAPVILLVLWYTALMISSVSNKLAREKININRLQGRNSEVKRLLYKFVLSIPVIGTNKVPFKALKGVSLEIGNGMYGLLGPNGAGKSTLMRVICGIYDQSYGKVWFNGIDTNLKREELQSLIGYLPQEFGMYENMSAWDYLDYQAILKGVSNRDERFERIEKVVRNVHLWDDRNKKIGSFSGGMKQRVGIAQVLLHLPRVLVVDEPTAGLDPRERIRFRNLLVELSRERIVIFSTHIIEDISSSCNQLAVLRKGEVQYIGSPRNMTETARGHVWQITISANDFEEYAKKYKIIHHLRDGENIRIRCISKLQPVPEAIEVEPNLEDAYLWLQNKEKE